MSSKYRVVILEDEKHNSEELSRLINNEPDLDIIAAVEDGITAEEICKTEIPDILFADIDVPAKSGFEVAKCAAEIGVCCIFSTQVKHQALNAFKIGAAGYLTKPYKKEEFIRTLNTARLILKGRRTVLKQNSLPEILKNTYKLTPAEIELSLLVLSGCMREDLAERLSKTERAVKSLLQNIYKKTINNSTGSKNTGRSDKYGRLIYFLSRLELTV